MSIIHAITELVANAPTIDIPEPIEPTDMPGQDKISVILGVIRYVALAVGVAGIIFAGARMAISHNRGDGATHIGALGWAIGGIAVIALAVSIVTFVVN